MLFNYKFLLFIKLIYQFNIYIIDIHTYLNYHMSIIKDNKSI